MNMKQQDFRLDVLIRRSSVFTFLICTALGGLAGAAFLLFPATYEARGKLLLSSNWIDNQEFGKAVVGSKTLRRLQLENYLGDRSNIILIPDDLELRIRAGRALEAKTQLENSLGKIRSEALQHLTRKYQAEATTMIEFSDVATGNPTDLNINIGGSLHERQVTVDLVLDELTSEQELVNLWLKEPIVHFPKPNIVIGAGLLAGAILGMFLNLIGVVGSREAARH